MKSSVAQMKLFSLGQEQNTKIYPGNSHLIMKRSVQAFANDGMNLRNKKLRRKMFQYSENC